MRIVYNGEEAGPIGAYTRGTGGGDFFMAPSDIEKPPLVSLGSSFESPREGEGGGEGGDAR